MGLPAPFYSGDYMPSLLTNRLKVLGSAFRWTAREIEEGRITPRSGETINFEGNPVCAFGWALHKAGSSSSGSDNGRLIVDFINDELTVLPKKELRKLKVISDRVAAVNDPLTGPDADPLKASDRKKIATSLRVVGKAVDNLLKISRKRDHALAKKKIAAAHKQREKVLV